MTLSRDLARLRVKRVRATGMPRWFDRIMALIALVNLLLIAFDLTYIPLRDFWLQGRVRIGYVNIGPLQLEGYEVEVLPGAVRDFITQYDAIKAIEPQRDTAQYLMLVDALREELVNSSLDSPAVASLLAQLRDRSEEIIETNPFALAGKTGTLEKIKNRIRDRVPNDQDSARVAFDEFWSQDYLQGRAVQELDFFQAELRPLFARNYFRPLSESGQFVDNFGLLDFPFFVLFLGDFLLRTFRISHRRAGVSWLDAMWWRWYDLPLFLPTFRWLRVITVIIRLNEADIAIDLEPIRRQASQGLVAGIAEDVTQVVIVRVINQFQTAIRQGEVEKLLSRSGVRQYIDLNEIDETAEIIRLLAHLAIEKVLPQIRPDLEALVQYNLEKALTSLPLYQALRQFPGMESLEQSFSDRAVKQLYETAYGALAGTLESDPVADKLWSQLAQHFTAAIATEIQGRQSIDRLEYLLTALLEEIKVNYVQSLSHEDVEEILEQTRSLREVSATQPYKPPTRPET